MKYLFKNSKYKNALIIIVLLLIYTFICAFSYVNAVSSGLSENVFRLHVLANSNSEEDQTLKHLVRDEIIEYLNKLTNNVSSKEEVIEIANSHLDDFKEIAKKVINKNGFNYNVNIQIGNFDFPTKEYGDISLPAGYYDALRVEIGSAEGNNWWCVLFPPLCFVDVSSGIVPEESKEILEESMTEGEYELISESSGDIKFKFKLLELFQNSNLRNC